jgi:hypothetical protein
MSTCKILQSCAVVGVAVFVVARMGLFSFFGPKDRVISVQSMLGSKTYSCNLDGFNSFVFWWNYKGTPFEIICWEWYWQYALMDIFGVCLFVFLFFLIVQKGYEYRNLFRF